MGIYSLDPGNCFGSHSHGRRQGAKLAGWDKSSAEAYLGNGMDDPEEGEEQIDDIPRTGATEV